MTQSCRAFRAFEFAAMPNGSRKRISGSGRVSRQDRQRRRVLIGRTRGTTGADWLTTERAVQRRASGRPKQSVTCDCLIYCVLYAVLCCVVKCPGKRNFQWSLGLPQCSPRRLRKSSLAASGSTGTIEYFVQYFDCVAYCQSCPSVLSVLRNQRGLSTRVNYVPPARSYCWWDDGV